MIYWIFKLRPIFFLNMPSFSLWIFLGGKDKAADLSGSDDEFYIESNSEEEEESASSGYNIYTRQTTKLAL